MKVTQPDEISINRKTLDFQKSCKYVFSYLLEHDFILYKEELNYLCYKSSFCIINIYHGYYSYEIGLEIAETESSCAYPLSLLIQLEADEKSDFFQRASATTKDFVYKTLLTILELLKKYGKRIFLHDKSLWHDLDVIKKQNIKKMADECRINNIRKKAEIVFREKQYEKVVKLYTEIQENLTSTERKRLAYALKSMIRTDKE